MVESIPSNSSMIVFTDASATGWGGYIAGAPFSECNGIWSITEMQESSTFRELKALANVLQANAVLLEQKEVIWYTDNLNASRIINTGSMVFSLQCIAAGIKRGASETSIHIFPRWIRRCFNEKADHLSKMGYGASWAVANQVFESLDRLWGPHQFDRFADHKNTKCRLFNSESFSPGTQGINAFSYGWEGFNNWLVPPVRLIAPAIRHLQACKASGTLVVPLWKSAAFWPLLVDERGAFRQFVRDSRIFKSTVGFFQHDTNKFFNAHCKFEMIAVRLHYAQHAHL